MICSPEKPLAFTGESTASSVLSSPLSLECIAALINATLKDFSKLNLYSEADIQRDMATVNRRLHHEGLTFVTKTLPEYIHGILNTLEGRDAIYPSFAVRLYRGRRVPVLFRGLAHIALNSNHKQHTKAFDALYQLCVGFKKLRGPYSQKTLLKQFVDFVKVDKELDTIDFDAPFQDKIMKTANSILRKLFCNFSFKEWLRPRPGSGSTCTATPRSARYSARTMFSKIDAVLPYSEWFYPNARAFYDDMGNYLAMKRVPKIPCAQMGYVPKTFGKPRGICMEENESQFFQQGARLAIEDYLSTAFPEVWFCINTHDQGRNQQLAFNASITRKDATIDESEASDRIAREAVKRAFANCGKDSRMAEVLLALSTEYIIPPKALGLKGILRARKYAPMGSGLCFPVMTLFHWAVIRSLIWHSGIRDSFKLSLDVSVYGDDIVIPSSHYDFVTTNLPLFGLKLNVNKSYVRSGFRESCGLHAISGAVVTPVYYKYIPKDTTLKSRIALHANIRDLIKKGFSETARVLQRMLVRTPFRVQKGTGVFGVEIDDVGFDALHQYHRKWSRDLQCWLYHVPRLVKSGENVEYSQHDGYFRWLLQHARRSNVVDYHEDYKISWSWVPAHTVLSVKTLHEPEITPVVENNYDNIVMFYYACAEATLSTP